MSQVIVTDDEFSAKRRETAEQEHRIATEQQFEKWRRSDISGRDPVATAVGFAFAPVAAFWAFLCALMLFVYGILRFVLRGLGGVIGQRGGRDRLEP